MSAEVGADSYSGWLEAIDGGAPILLIAPHGGAACGKGGSLSIPKVNDLHTAAITRELAARLDASALINGAMDRNHLDCNRVGQLVTSAPWLLDLLADRLERMIAAHGSAVVLSIHGWNLVEPRVDIGVGLRARGGGLQPARGAAVSVSEDFLNHTLIPLTAGLRAGGIAATFGMRYPAAAANNLIQALTPRNANSETAALRRLAGLASRGRIEAVQLELSIALRFPGAGRSRILDTIIDALRTGPTPRPAATRPISTIDRLAPARAATAAKVSPGRLGFEIYDRAKGIGILASVDAGGATTSARVMIMMAGGPVAMYTSEGHLERIRDGVRIGALDLRAGGGAIQIGLRAPMLITPESVSYCDIESALACSALDESTELEAVARLTNQFDIGTALERMGRDGPGVLAPVFGSVSGRFAIAGTEHRLEAVGRVGPALTSLDGAGFEWRQSVWAVFNEDGRERGIELREQGRSRDRRAIQLFADGVAPPCRVDRFAMAEATPSRPPATISAMVADGSGRRIRLDGSASGFVPLVRPGPNGARIFTMLGVARFTIGGRPGAGMFEQSRLLAGDSRIDETPD